MVEEVLHIAVNTPQIYEVPKTQRSRLLAILQSYLQKRVMQFLQGCSDDPEELSHRQLEANRFRSTVMKQVYQLLREEQEREMSMSSTVVNGFEYFFSFGFRALCSIACFGNGQHKYCQCQYGRL